MRQLFQRRSKPAPAADHTNRSAPRLCLGLFAALLTCAANAVPPAAAPTPLAYPAALTRLPAIIDRDLRDSGIPGAVVMVGNADAVLFEQSFGARALLPAFEPMSVDTVFDLASLTKVIATTTAVLQLVEKGQLQLDAPVSRYWPAFGQRGKQAITLRHLLTHHSGLRADLPVPRKQPWQGHAGAVHALEQLITSQTPGTIYLYSDVNFLILGELVQRVSGQTLADYCDRHIFTPLQMRHTRFQPPSAWQSRIAPTLVDRDGVLRGRVHDPVARRMDGIAGHAGLFATAADLARFARMLLHDGELDGVRILQPQSVQLLRSPQSPAAAIKLRGLGWDLAAPFAPNRLALPQLGGFGHTGYTGTSLWIDPVQRLYAIILTNRVHPNDRARVQILRTDIGIAISDALAPLAEKAIAEYLPDTPLLALDGDVHTGIDVLSEMDFAPLAGKRIGLITNHSGRDRHGTSTIELLRRSKTAKLVALFSPEHGLEGLLDERVASGTDKRSQLPVHSLYGKTLRPTPAMLNGIDALVFDIQDAGARFYTYISTMGYALEAAAAAGIEIYVLDRPNPIAGNTVQGPLLDADLKSFTAYFPLPVRHGMTVAELARLFNVENGINARLRVVPMRGYRRELWFDQTGLDWVNPSPNLRSLAETTLYPGVAIVEGANVSVGRGTGKPFELIGAPWIDGVQLSRYLRQRNIDGVHFRAVRFTPTSSLYAGKLCHGVRIELTDRERLDSPLLGIELAAALQHLYPQAFDLKATTGMIGSRAVVEAIRQGTDPRELAPRWAAAVQQFRQLRQPYLLY